MRNEIEESQSSQRSTNGIEEFLSQMRSAEHGWVRSVECIIEAPVGIEELPSRAEEHRMGGYRVQNGVEDYWKRRN